MRQAFSPELIIGDHLFSYLKAFLSFFRVNSLIRLLTFIVLRLIFNDFFDENASAKR